MTGAPASASAWAPTDRGRRSREWRALAAILRVADALDRAHQQKVRSLEAQVEDDRLVVTVAGTADLTIEQLGLQKKADLFREVFGLRVVVRERRAGRRESPTRNRPPCL